MTGSARISPLNLAAVVVLYRTAPHKSASVISLQRAATAADGVVRLHLMLYDNTPGDQDSGSLPAGSCYVASPRNQGLAEAYNRAIPFAQERQCTWLLTLDQDTDLPTDFLLRMAHHVAAVEETPEVAAVVPQIRGHGCILSPYRFLAGAVPSWFPAGFQGISQAVFAFNSAALIRLSALGQIGGYQPWFWLDCSDANLFWQLHQVGKRVLVAGDIQVDHDFSMKDRRNSVSPARYRNILLAESAVWDLQMSFPAGCERTARLLLRMVQHVRRDDPPAVRRITAEFLKRRLFWSRARRLRAWRQETLDLFPNLASVALPSSRNDVSRLPGPSAARPRISVCMAAYNSASYIDQQIRSILHQLAPEDELIIVDDASTDHTVEVIRALQAPSIHLIQRATNQGVVATFEQALRNATGEILFLADGDDIWDDRKVDLILEAFRANPSAAIVTSRVSFIDQQNTPIHDTMYDNRDVFQSGFWHNLLRNHFQGSAMALRASLLGSVLPFPRGVAFLHDQWIGMRNARMGGHAVMLEQPLLLYRRHPHNLSRRMSRLRQVIARLQLIGSHLAAAVRDHF